MPTYNKTGVKRNITNYIYRIQAELKKTKPLTEKSDRFCSIQGKIWLKDADMHTVASKRNESPR